MGCQQCEKTTQAAFYNRYVPTVGHAVITLLMKTAYDEGIRMCDGNTVKHYGPSDEILTIYSKTLDVKIEARKGSNNITLTKAGKRTQIPVNGVPGDTV